MAALTSSTVLSTFCITGLLQHKAGAVSTDGPFPALTHSLPIPHWGHRGSPDSSSRTEAPAPPYRTFLEENFRCASRLVCYQGQGNQITLQLLICHFCKQSQAHTPSLRCSPASPRPAPRVYCHWFSRHCRLVSAPP